MDTPMQRWAASKQKIEELNAAAAEPAQQFMDACRELWRDELTTRYPEAAYKKANIIIRVPAAEEPNKVVALEEAIVKKGGTVTQILESEGHFYVVVN